MKRILIVFCSVVLSLTPSVSGTTCSSSSFFPTEIQLSSSGTVEYIESPNYPSDYPGGTTCYYRVIAPSGYKISYRFATDFHMESDIGCDSWDYIILYDSSTSSSMIGRYCGTAEPSASTTTGRYLFIKFKSDYSNQYKGFRAGFVVGTTPPSSSDVQAVYSSALTVGAIVGLVIAILIVLGIIACIVFCIVSSKKTPGTVITTTPASNQVASTNIVVTNTQSTMMANPQPAPQPPPPQMYPPLPNQGYPPPGMNPAYPPPPQQYPPGPPPAYY